MPVTSRARPHAVALESTLLLHGVPRESARQLAADLNHDVESSGASPALAAIITGVPTVGVTHAEFETLLAAPSVPKANTANLGVLIHRKEHGATTVSTTMELAAAAGVRVFATGGLGGVHRGYAQSLDISSDLAALARFPVGVVASGVKGLLDVVATREALEALGVPVIGFRTDAFPAFYVRESSARVDARFDDAASLGAFLQAELTRTNRGVLIVQPIAPEHAISPQQFESWLHAAERDAEVHKVSGRAVTPFLLAKLHELSRGATLRANIELVRANARLAGQIAAAMSK